MPENSSNLPYEFDTSNQAIAFMDDQALTITDFYRRDLMDPNIHEKIITPRNNNSGISGSLISGPNKRINIESSRKQISDTQIKYYSLRSLAKCIGIKSEMFFSEIAVEQQEAKELCQDCRIRPACLEYALEAEEKYGVWGGMTPIERAKEIKARKELSS